VRGEAGRAGVYWWLNIIEAGVWIVMGLGVVVWTVRTGSRRVGLVAGAALVLFGLSDVVEAGTGAWWRPWWLLAWKLACVATLLGVVALWARKQRAGSKPS